MYISLVIQIQLLFMVGNVVFFRKLQEAEERALVAN
jgi:hypothetical protein